MKMTACRGKATITKKLSPKPFFRAATLPLNSMASFQTDAWQRRFLVAPRKGHPAFKIVSKWFPYSESQQVEYGKATGFTLVELLIVMAIIALLVSILLPSFGRAKELAREVKCSVHMKYVGVGFLSYAGEYDDYFPVVHGDDYNNPEPPSQEWWEYLLPCGFSRENMVCPSDPYGDKEVDDPDKPGEKKEIDSYIFNGMFAFSKRLDQVDWPSEKIIVSERGDKGSALVHQGYPAWKARTVWEGLIKKDRHGETSNYLMCDWSVRAMRWDQTIGDGSDEQDMHYIKSFDPPIPRQ